MEDAERIATKLAQSRSAGTVLELDAAELPTDLDAAERVQDILWNGSERAAGGWKLGATNKASSASFPFPRPFAGRISAENLLSHGGQLSLTELRQKGCEGELAAVMGTTLAPSSSPISDSAVADAVAGWTAAIEFPQSTYSELGIYGGPALVADNGAAGWAAAGDAIELSEPPAGSELAAMITTMRLDGEVVAEGSAAELLKDPVETLADHVRYLHARGHALEVGHVVLLGGLTPYVPLTRGGRLELEIAASRTLRVGIDLV